MELGVDVCPLLFFVSVHPCCVEGDGGGALNDVYALMMEKSSKKWRKGLAIFKRRCIVCPVTEFSTNHTTKEIAK